MPTMVSVTPKLCYVGLSEHAVNQINYVPNIIEWNNLARVLGRSQIEMFRDFGLRLNLGENAISKSKTYLHEIALFEPFN
jgi:hypothetical protein